MTVPRWVPCNGPEVLWERFQVSEMEHRALNPTEFHGPPQSCNNFKQYAQLAHTFVFVLTTQVDDDLGLQQTRKQSI